jgi:hypothetical protein
MRTDDMRGYLWLLVGLLAAAAACEPAGLCPEHKRLRSETSESAKRELMDSVQGRLEVKIELAKLLAMDKDGGMTLHTEPPRSDCPECDRWIERMLALKSLRR